MNGFHAKNDDKPHHRPNSIAVTMVISFSILCTGLLFCSSYSVAVAAHRKTIATISSNNIRLLNRDVERVDELAGIITQTSFYVVGDGAFKQLLMNFPFADPLARADRWREIQNYLTQIWINRPEIAGVCLYMDGFTSFSSGIIGYGPASVLHEQGWLTELKGKAGTFISTPKLLMRNNAFFNLFSLVPIIGENQDVLGYLSFEISYKKLFDRCFRDSLASPESTLFAVGKDGTIMSHADMFQIGKQAKEVYPVLNQPEQQEQVVNGKKTLLLSSKPNNMGLCAVEIIPEWSVYDTRHLTYLITLFCTLGCFFASLIILLLCRRFTKPITYLALIMDKADPMDKALPEKYMRDKTEVGMLYRNFRSMQDAIKELITQLKTTLENKRIAEVNALRSQISPHFLYNTLDYINWMALDHDEKDISKMLTLLSRFLRNSITNSTLSSSIAKEIETTNAYLAIFQAKDNGRFFCRWDIDDKTLGIAIPQFTLQPLVENSIIHGFGKQLTGGEISIFIKKHAQKVIFDICDNGKGMLESQFADLLSNQRIEGHGKGLKNIQERIAFMYPGNSFSGFSLIPQERGTHIHFEIYPSVAQEDTHGT